MFFRRLEGWLPLTEVRSPLFASALVSSAFGVGGGPLADNETTSLLLCRAAEELAQRHAVSSVEIRGGSAPEGWQAITGKHANFSRPLAADREAELLAIPRKARADCSHTLPARSWCRGDRHRRSSSASEIELRRSTPHYHGFR